MEIIWKRRNEFIHCNKEFIDVEAFKEAVAQSNEYLSLFTFNPWRWKGKKLHGRSKTFLAFGGGLRVCVGADFAKLQMAIILHYLVSKYRWTIIKGGEVARKPGVVFPNGLHIKISDKA